MSEDAPAVLAKPPKRGPKPRKPIPRQKRLTRKEKVKKRRVSKRARLVRQCDELWTQYVKREGHCLFLDVEPGHVCEGPLQAMHGISRRYHGSRWDTANGVPGCSRIHYRYTKEPMSWTRWLIERWGLTGYDAMWAKAQAGKPRDMGAVLAGLRAKLGLISASE